MTSDGSLEPREFGRRLLAIWAIGIAVGFHLWVPVMTVLVAHRREIHVGATVYAQLAVQVILGLAMMRAAVGVWRREARALIGLVALMSLHFGLIITVNSLALLPSVAHSLDSIARTEARWRIYRSVFGILLYASALFPSGRHRRVDRPRRRPGVAPPPEQS